MVLPPISDFPEAQIFEISTLPSHEYGAVLTLDRNDEDALIEHSRIMRERLIVPEVWKELLPEASLLISSAICGGDITERFREAAMERLCWLLVEPIRMRFPLPCLDGCGEPVPRIPEGHHFYSEALCCYYAHFPDSVVLWDTESTLQTKLQLAKAAGFLGFVSSDDNKNSAVK